MAAVFWPPNVVGAALVPNAGVVVDVDDQQQQRRKFDLEKEI